VNGVEQPRVLLVSVPYAMKAGDAETLGGLPASAFLLSSDVLSTRVSKWGGLAGASASDGLTTAAAGTMTAGKIAKFDVDNATLVDSVMTEANSKVGVGTTSAPIATFQVQNGAAPGGSVPAVSGLLLSGTGPANRLTVADGNKVTYLGTLGASGYGEFSTYDYSTGTAFNFVLNANGGKVGIGTITPIAKLHVRNGGSPGVHVPAVAGLMVSGGGSSNRVMIADGDKVTYLGTVGASNYGEFSTYDYSNSTGFNFVLNANGGNVGVGTITPAAKLDVNGTVKGKGLQVVDGNQAVGKVLTSDASGNANWATPAGGGAATDVNCGSPCIGTGEIVDSAVTSAKIADGTILDADINSSAATRIRGINYIAGCDSCSALSATDDDQPTIYQDVIGTLYITGVTCFTNAGSPTINLKRNNGSTATDIMAAAIACDGTAKTNFNGTEYQLVSGNRIDFDLVDASTANRVTVVIKAVVQ
jgi:hypothetical protein